MYFRKSRTFQNKGANINSNKLLDINPLVIKISVVVIYTKNPGFLLHYFHEIVTVHRYFT